MSEPLDLLKDIERLEARAAQMWMIQTTLSLRRAKHFCLKEMVGLRTHGPTPADGTEVKS